MKKILFILLIFSSSLQAQEYCVSNDVSDIVDCIEQYGILHSQFSGQVVKMSKEYLLHEALTEIASKEELTELVKHKNPIIRCYAFRALCEQKGEEFYMLEAHILDDDPLDSAIVKISQGEKIIEEKVNRFMTICFDNAKAPYLNLSIKKLSKSIARINRLDSEMTGGMSPSSSKAYKFFVALRYKATKDELIRLTNHDNAVVRCYSFLALYDRKESNLFPILIKHLKDTTNVSGGAGCISFGITVADFYTNLLAQRPSYFEDNNQPIYSRITKKELLVLDSIVLHEANHLSYLEFILSKHKPNPKDYELIKKLVEGNNCMALPALSRFRKEEDVALIMSFKNFKIEKYVDRPTSAYFFDAIAEFPHPSFKDFLEDYNLNMLTKNNFGQSEQEFYYAVASYDNEFSVKILNSVFKHLNGRKLERHLEKINIALGKFPSKNHEELIISLWEKHSYLMLSSFEYLKAVHPDRTFNLAKSYMLNYNYKYGWEAEELILPILEYISAKNKEEAIKLVNINLKNSSVTTFEEFSKLVKVFKDERFIESLLYRIEYDNGFYADFLAVKLLIANYNKEGLKEKIVRAIANNSSIKDKEREIAYVQKLIDNKR